MQDKKSNAVTLIFIFVAIIGLLPFVVGTYISSANKANQLENKLEAAYETSESVLAQYGQKVVEVAQVTDMARDDISRITKDAIGGRYGKDGSKAIFQAITEQNPTVDPQLYRQIQQVVESGRNQFQTSQTTMIDVKREYKEKLGSVWTGMWMGFAGYPKANLEKYKIVTTDRASDSFKTGKETGPIKLR